MWFVLYKHIKLTTCYFGMDKQTIDGPPSFKWLLELVAGVHVNAILVLLKHVRSSDEEVTQGNTSILI